MKCSSFLLTYGEKRGKEKIEKKGGNKEGKRGKIVKGKVENWMREKF